MKDAAQAATVSPFCNGEGVKIFSSHKGSIRCMGFFCDGLTVLYQS
jgi:hypothetical protein